MARQPNNNANRFLHLIFFAGSGKTYNIKCPQGAAWLVVALCACLLSWSVVSVALNSWLWHKNVALEEQLVETRQHLFLYQAQVENTYEQAYPAVNTQNEAAVELPAEPIEGLALQETEPMPPLLLTQVGELSDLPASEVEKAAAAETKSFVAAAEVKLPSAPVATIEQLRIDDSAQNRLNLQFQIRSQNLGDQVKGRVVAVAVFTDYNKQKHYFPAPSRVQLEAGSHEVLQSTQGEAFAVRRFRPTSFSIAKPTKLKGYFSQVLVKIYGQDGRLISELVEDLPIPAVAKQEQQAAGRQG